MGYTTDFSGRLNLTPAATAKQVQYINEFSATRRMARDVNKLMKLYNGEFGRPMPFKLTDEQKSHVLALEAEGLSVSVVSKKPINAIEVYGIQGEFLANERSENDGSVINQNQEPSTQPGLWCQWVLTKDGEHLEWDGGEKFYNYIEWLQYMIKNFFEPWGIKLNGEITWVGEDSSDRGKIKVTDNKVEVFEGRTTYKKVK